MSTIATLTKSGRASIARKIAADPVYIAWGEGEAAWDDLADAELPSLVDRTALYNPVGLRRASIVGFCEPSDTGDIVVPIGTTPTGGVEEARYQQKTEPAPYLYIRAMFDFADASSATIREVGIMLDCEPQSDLPPGQMYFAPEQMAEAGDLLAIQILRPKILRSPAVRQIIEFVLPI